VRATLFLPCPAGVEPLLADEAARLAPGAGTRAGRGGVALHGDLALAMRLNLESRLAGRVLLQLADGPYRDEHDLYDLARSVDWRHWIAPEQTLRVDVTAQRSPLRSLHFAGLRIKDGVCDRLREAFGRRPDVDLQRPDLPLVLHLGPERAILYVDTSGEPLFKRGWRADTGDAPLKETLAAALLAAAGWTGRPETGGALLDPCCGSGTIAIEAAQVACGIAPGALRRFAFERLLPFRAPALRDAWQAMKAEAAARAHAPAVPVHASDVAFRMVDFARRNAERAGVAHAIEFHGGDALERPAPVLPPELPGTLVVNPPYGERIEPAGAGRVHRLERDHALRASAEDRDVGDDFFARLASHWKKAFTSHPAGWTAWVLSPDRKLERTMRLKASRRVPLWNGPIECRLFAFELVAGSARADRGERSAPEVGAPD
jgi:putative N6-adenine-specific DNA methylase